MRDTQVLKTVTRLLATYLALLYLAIPCYAADSDIVTLKARYVKTLLDSVPAANQVQKILETLHPDGTWPDINYKDKKNNWSQGKHLERICYLAKAYRDKEGKFYKSAKVKDALVKALAHWLKKDYKNYNWWVNDIAVPAKMADLMVLMGNDLPTELKGTILSTIMPRSKNGKTGQNRVWLAKNNFMKCLTTGKVKELKDCRDIILSEIRISTEEGIQPDWSFHQHGPQQQFGNYGKAFGDTQTKFALLLRGTSFALGSEELSILRNYLLEGPSWILWKGRMDFSGCGRQIWNNCQTSRGRIILSQIRRMIEIDPAHAGAYQERLTGNETGGENTLIGNKLFWRSDMMVHRRSDWYASVKMSSLRVIGSESCNGENMRGLHLGDGVFFVYRTAAEYDGIQPFWDWRRLPGTTCDQSIKSLVPILSMKLKLRNQSEFVGGVTDGTQGIAVMEYNRGKLSARKAWFFLDDAVVCLGAGIHSEKSGQILTSVQQSLLQGDVVTSTGKESEGKHQLKPGDWVHHAGFGYALIAGKHPTLQIAEQKGDWKNIFSQKKRTPASGKVFSLWIDHGKSPKNQSYAYAVFPQTSADDMPARVKNPGFEILSNTRDLQAVKAGNTVYAVFYEPGTIKWGDGQSVTVNRACALIVESGKMFLSDPKQKEQRIEVGFNESNYSVKLPRGGEAGKSKFVNLTATEHK